MQLIIFILVLFFIKNNSFAKNNHLNGRVKLYNESKINFNFTNPQDFDIIDDVLCPIKNKNITCVVSGNVLSDKNYLKHLNENKFRFVSFISDRPIMTFTNNVHGIKKFEEIFNYKIGIMKQDISVLLFLKHFSEVYKINKKNDLNLKIKVFNDINELLDDLLVNEIQSTLIYDYNYDIFLENEIYKITDEAFNNQKQFNKKITWFNRNKLQIKSLSIPIDFVPYTRDCNYNRFYSYHKVIIDDDRSVYTITIPKILITNINKDDKICRLISSIEEKFNTRKVTTVTDHTANQPLPYWDYIEYCRQNFYSLQPKEVEIGAENIIYLNQNANSRD
jgi:hypothetical protein